MATKTRKTPAKSTAKKKGLSKETYQKWYKSMLLARKFEEKTGQLYIQQKFGGFCHLYIGQEAVLAGLTEAMIKDDKVITAYRDHAHPIMMGIHPKYVMAEMYGKQTGTSKGKGGSMHMFAKEVGLFGGHGIVGAQIAMGAGMALAEKARGNKNVAFTFFGDGAARQGILHETFNMAMTWNLPVVFCVENNQYAMGTSVKRTSNVTNLSDLADSYHMPNKEVDGMNPDECYEAFKEAADRARKGEGPTLLDINTYRYKGHSMSDPQKYRTKEEVEQYKEQDPITYVKNIIEKNKWMKEADFKKVQDEVKALVEESVKFAEESPDPTIDELYKDVYVQEDYPFIKE
jgi:pyruvate dehydrogenase E1 component alpha subunit